MIPSKFKIGAQWFTVELVNEIDNEYGEFSYTPPVIKIAKTLDGEEIPQNQLEATFWHEFFHACQYMFNCETDEAQAQCFSNFMMEFLETKQ